MSNLIKIIMASLVLLSLTACGGGGTWDCKNVTCDGDENTDKNSGDSGDGPGDSGDGPGDSGDGSGDSGDGSGDSGDGPGDSGDGSGDSGVGSGDSGDGSGVVVHVPSVSAPRTKYVTFDQTGDLVSNLAGVAILIDTSNKTSQSVDLTGAFGNKDGQLVLNNGTYEFIANTAGVSGDTYVNAAKTGTLTVLSADKIRTAEYAQMVDVFYVKDGTSYNTMGIMGVPTVAADMPSTGTVSFTGDIRGAAVTPAQGVDILDGTSKIDVNFGTDGSVNVTLDNFKFQDQSTGAGGSGPFDKILITEMTLDDYGFANGTVQVLKSGSNVDLTGENTTTASDGGFFGYDTETGNPDAAGGILLLQGDNGFLTTTYLGD